MLGFFQNSKKHGVGTMKIPDGTVFEEVWDEGKFVTRKIIEKPKVVEEESKKENVRKTLSVQNFLPKPRKPKIMEDGLSFMAHLNVTQYMNEKLLNKNSKFFLKFLIKIH